MKNRKWIAFICLLLVSVIFATACNEVPEGTMSPTETMSPTGTTQETTDEKPDTNSDEGQNGNQNTNDNNIENNEKTECNEHDYEEVSRVEAMALKDGEIKYVCSVCEDEKTETVPATKSLKVLALGNSFTDDSTAHLWRICKDGGVEKVIVANLYKGNCTLDTHWSNISNNKAAYTYKKNTNGTFVNTAQYKMIDAIKDEKWDIIVLHQTSGSAGFANTYTKLNNIINYVNENKTNPDAKIFWHMPWAYQSDSAHSEFSKYDKNQMKMYGEILARVKELILTREDIAAIIPSATAIQNLRTSYVGDTVTRDGYHLNYGFGRYTAGLVWYAALTGGSIDVIDWIPSNYPEVQNYLPAIKESVKNAMAKNFEVTQSLITSGNTTGGNTEEIDPSEILNPADFIEADRALAALNRVNIDDYELLEWDYVENAYWHCTQRTNFSHPKSSSSTYNQNICTDKKYSTADELPAGTIFICDAGWRYLLEIFPEEDEIYTGTRHGGTTEAFYVLTEDFLDGCKYIAWDVSSYPKTDISAIFHQAAAHIRVYVPIDKTAGVQTLSDKDIAAFNGVNLDNYELLEWDYVENAYWHCTQRTNIYHPNSGSTYNQNICTDKKFSVDTELPAGSIFICDEGWRFLIDIFPNENEKYTGTRPSGVTDAFYMITEEFLNGCKYIAWNVSSYPKTDISSKFAEAATHIRVYVPKQ